MIPLLSHFYTFISSVDDSFSRTALHFYILLEDRCMHPSHSFHSVLASCPHLISCHAVSFHSFLSIWVPFLTCTVQHPIPNILSSTTPRDIPFLLTPDRKSVV